MATPQRKPDLISPADYFAGEVLSEVKHEFVDGMVYAMAGGTIRHDLITGNLVTYLNLALELPCRVFNGNVRLGRKTKTGEWYHYPDTFVSCGDLDELAHGVDDALVIFEVLSQSTERSDRYEKFERSKTLPKLEEYVLVEQSLKRLEIYRKHTGWSQQFLHPDEPLVLESVGMSLTFDQVYRRVSLDVGMSS